MKLADLCTKIGSGATPRGGKESYKDAGIPILRSQNILDWRFSPAGLAYIDDIQAAQLSNVELKPDDVLLNITGDSVARCCKVPASMIGGRVNQHVSIIRAGAHLNADYLLCFILSSKPLLLKLAASGATRNALTKSMIGELEINPPSLEEQERIASVVSSIQMKIESNAKLNDYLAELLDVIFTKAREDADGWEEATLLDIANYKNGLAMQKFRPEGGDPGLPVLKIKELGQGSCGSDAERCRSDIDESVRIYDGDLVFSWSGTLLLDFWAGGDAGLNQHLFKVTSEKYPSWFVYMWTKYHMRKFIALAKDRATTMGHIKRSALAEAEVQIPPADILDKLTGQMQPVVDQMIGLKVEARKLGELRDVLLPKLMSGEIDVSKIDLTQLNNHLAD